MNGNPVSRTATIRFEGELATSERHGLERALRSAGATVTSWNLAAGRTYACAVCDADSVALPPGLRAQCFMPALVVLRISAPRERLPGVAEALGGSGAPAGIGDVRPARGDLIVEVDPSRTPLSLVIALIDTEAGPLRRVAPVTPLEDDALTALASFLLGEPNLDTSRLIEAYVEPMLVKR